MSHLRNLANLRVGDLTSPDKVDQLQLNCTQIENISIFIASLLTAKDDRNVAGSIPSQNHYLL